MGTPISQDFPTLGDTFGECSHATEFTEIFYLKEGLPNSHEFCKFFIPKSGCTHASCHVLFSRSLRCKNIFDVLLPL